MFNMKFHKKMLEIDAAAETDRIVSALRKNVRLMRRYGAVLGISGGIDSSVVLALCVRAFGREKVVAIMMPEKDSDPESEQIARRLAGHFGVNPTLEGLTPILDGFGCYPRRDEAIRRVFPDYNSAAGYKAKIVLPQNLLDEGTLNVFTLVVITPDGNELRKQLPVREFLQIVAASNFKQRTRMSMVYYHAEVNNYAVIGTANKNEHDQGFFVKYGDGLHVHAAIAIFHEKSLVMFILVRGSDYGVLPRFRMIIKRAHSRALLEIARGDNLEHFTRRQRLGLLLAIGSDNCNGKNIQRIGFEEVLRQDNLRLVTLGSIEFGKYAPNRVVTPMITIKSLQRCRDVFKQRLDVKLGRQFARVCFTNRIGIFVWHHYRDYSLGGKSPHSKGQDHSRINATADAHDRSSPHILAHGLLKKRYDPLRLTSRIESQGLFGETHTGLLRIPLFNLHIFTRSLADSGSLRLKSFTKSWCVSWVERMPASAMSSVSPIPAPLSILHTSCSMGAYLNKPTSLMLSGVSNSRTYSGELSLKKLRWTGAR